ncbi:hypothetical protein K0M31_013930 [Melipona bicolor]|uniref:Uncharacterized protein n=1 Tax=Melipona bicolor TaxID=60889 RepID=A0AA40G7I6_9HYME|nr:hypothetical protein K0M31_013930 [Melipona bicolor]
MEVRQDRASCYAKYPETGQRVPYRKDEATSGFLARAILVRCSTSVFRMDACPGNLSQEGDIDRAVSGEARKGRNDSRDLSGREDATLGGIPEAKRDGRRRVGAAAQELFEEVTPLFSQRALERGVKG